MKTFLLSLTVVLTFIVASKTAYVPFFRFMRELDELKASTYLEHQEQGPASLDCSSCVAATEAECTAMQTPVVCPSGALNCFTLELSSNAGVTNFSRGCFPDMFCNQDFLCFAFNATAGFSLVSCAVQCCNTSECNAGVLPTTPSPPSTAATTMAPTTQTTAPTTPTTPAVIVVPLVGLSGVFTTPGFPGNYPDNTTVIWTITVPRGRRLRLTFTLFTLSDTDFVRVSVGVRSITFTDNFRRGKRSFPSYYDEFVDEDNGYYYDDDVDDAFYYYYDGRRKEEDDDGPFIVRGRTLFVRGSNQQISIQFSSGASGNAQGFSASFQDENDPGSESSAGSASSAGSSDEEE